MKHTYLEKGLTQMYCRKDKRIVTIRIVNESNKRIKIRKTHQDKLQQILFEIFLDNNELIMRAEGSSK